KKRIVPDISIVDFKIQRKVVYKNLEELGFRKIKLLKKAKNEAGTISKEAEIVLSSLIKNEAKPSILQIEGEEDLLALLSIFLAPLKSLIVYGQPNEGIVVVEVTEEKKQSARNLLNKFT
ncbi:MAG: GTP-dependent dephospho-CoA kinase family protein, partial [Patescibacteria group bacterium]